MLLKFSVYITYFLTSLLSIEGMTIISRNHDSKKHGGSGLRPNVVRKIYFDPAPSVDSRRRRKTSEQNIQFTPISNVPGVTSNQAQIKKATEEALANFLLKNGEILAAAVTTIPPQVTSKSERPQVTVQASTPVSETVSTAGKRNSIAYNIQVPEPRASNNLKEALSYEMVENLVVTIQKNNQLDIPFVVQDLKNKLDMVLDKHVPGMRGSDADHSTEKPKGQNLIKEMDKIMDKFFRATSHSSSSSSESSSHETLPIAQFDPNTRSDIETADDNIRSDIQTADDNMRSDTHTADVSMKSDTQTADDNMKKDTQTADDNMRSDKQDADVKKIVTKRADRLNDEEEEDLEFDLDGDDAGEHERLRFNLKEK